MTQETKNKISCTLKSKGIKPLYPMNWKGIKRYPNGNSPLKGKKRPIEIGKKISQIKKGHSVSKETRLKISKSLVGFRHSEETKIKFRNSRGGNKNWNYIEDRNLLVRRNRSDPESIEWRRKVYTRDNFKCRMSNSDCDGEIQAHHILPWRDFVELRYEVNNGITLCRAHHPRKWSEEKRLAPYFKELVSVS